MEVGVAGLRRPLAFSTGCKAMLIAALTALHAMAAAAWVGGMFFAYMILRVTAPTEPGARLALWARTLTRFFPWVWIFIAVLVLSGYALLGQGVRRGWPIEVMQGVGWVMFAIFAYLSLRVLPALKRGVGANDLGAAAGAMKKMRPLIAINLVLGLTLIALGASARYIG